MYYPFSSSLIMKFFFFQSIHIHKFWNMNWDFWNAVTMYSYTTFHYIQEDNAGPIIIIIINMAGAISEHWLLSRSSRFSFNSISMNVEVL